MGLAVDLLWLISIVPLVTLINSILITEGRPIAITSHSATGSHLLYPAPAAAYAAGQPYLTRVKRDEEHGFFDDVTTTPAPEAPPASLRGAGERRLIDRLRDRPLLAWWRERRRRRRPWLYDTQPQVNFVPMPQPPPGSQQNFNRTNPGMPDYGSSDYTVEDYIGYG